MQCHNLPGKVFGRVDFFKWKQRTIFLQIFFWKDFSWGPSIWQWNWKYFLCFLLLPWPKLRFAMFSISCKRVSSYRYFSFINSFSILSLLMFSGSSLLSLGFTPLLLMVNSKWNCLASIFSIVSAFEGKTDLIQYFKPLKWTYIRNKSIRQE